MFRLGRIALLTLCAHPLFGGVVLDGSFGTRGPVPSVNNNFMISANYGTQRGANLFQSFSQFNLNSLQSATFMGPSNVHNILARVTSGSPSSIDGTIHSGIQAANLFFMNPAGVLFGQHAQLDVSGSVAVTTANYLKLVGGGRFNANLGGGDVLTSEPVSAFGFLNSAPAPVSITGSTLNVASQKSFSAVAGDITMNGGTISGEGSRVNLVSVKSPGEVGLDATNINSPIDVTQFTAMGDIDLTNFTVNTSGAGGGSVVIRGGSVSLDNGQGDINLTNFTVNTSGAGGGRIVIRGGNLIIQNSSILSLTNGIGNGGGVRLTAKSLLSLRDVGIYTDTNGMGNGGDVTLTAKSLVIDSTSLEKRSVIQANTYGSGNAGNIAFRADSLLIQGPSAIASNTVRLGSIDPAELFSIGNAGNVTLTANSFLMQGNSISLEPVIESIALGTAGDGRGGNIAVTANSVFIGPFAAIVAQTLGAGDAGTILVNAGTLQLEPNGFISTSTFGSSGGGNITVVADSVLIDGTGELKGPSGNFFTGIFAQAEGRNFQLPGKGGDITVTATDLVLQNAGAISAQSFVSSTAGSVRLSLGTLSMDTGSLISSANTGSGEAGKVVIDTTGPMKLKHGSSISTSSDVGDAGSIELISGGKIRLRDQSSITASAGASGGSIHLTAPDLVYLTDSSITATAGVDGGNIFIGNSTIDPQFIVLNNSPIRADARRQGGNINLMSDFFFASNSPLTVTGTVAGTVNITAPELDLGSQLITLPSSLLSAESQLQERCTALLQGDFSSFISIGRGGTEPAPEELQSTF